MSIKDALDKFRPTRPADYPYLTDEEWLKREVAILGCRTGLWHVSPDFKHILSSGEWDGSMNCWCSFWDAQ